MKAMALQKYGSADDLAPIELPKPKVAPDEVLIRVKAAGVNPVDWKFASGGLDSLLEGRFPLVPGWDVAGVVEEVGLDAGEFAVGDEVMAYARKDWVQNGTYAEQVSAHVRMIAHKPAALDFEQAAGLPLAGLTAYQSLRRVAADAGETVLVHAAAGGVGSLAVQIAVAWGARVIGTASERNHDFLRSLGAEPVSYGEGLTERLRALAPAGIDAAVDFVGVDAVEVSRPLLKHAGRIATVAELGTEGVHHVWVRPSPGDLTALGELAEQGRLSVPLERVLPLEEAGEAWRLSQTGRTRGKLVLRV